MTIDISDLPNFLADLSTTDPDKFTVHDIKLIKWYCRSDGCTGVVDIFVVACIKHDFRYRTHHDFDGRMITRAKADLLFMQDIQKLSKLGKFELVSYERWLGVRLLGAKAWEGRHSCHSH